MGVCCLFVLARVLQLAQSLTIDGRRRMSYPVLPGNPYKPCPQLVVDKPFLPALTYCLI